MEKKSKATSQSGQPKPKSAKLPPQASPRDTRNWDDRQFKTPSGRIIIETDQTPNGKNVIAE